jgi:alpha-galactosidase
MQGDVWGVHLGWSGNHRLRAEENRRPPLSAGRSALSAGRNGDGGGETLWTPRLYASYSAQG